MSVYELTAKELYDSYAGEAGPDRVLEQTRIDLATRLRVEEGLKQEDAYYAADQMLTYAQQLVAAREEE